VTAYHHLSVMLPDVVAALRPAAGEVFVDCTFGGGGHTRALLEAADCRVVAIDRDPEALANVAPLKERFGDRVSAHHAAFSQLAEVLSAAGIPAVDGIFADLGVSSHQLDTAARGFSFRAAGPLDMRMDPTRGTTAAELVNTADERELTRILREYGEEPRAGRVAQALVAGRPWSDTLTLADAVARVVGHGAKAGRIHPATRTFQALRIAVNGELAELETLLPTALSLLRPGGRLAFLTFHSLEDRIVKRFFAVSSGKGRPRDPYGNPLGPVHLEVHPDLAPTDPENPRARSARLRSATRLPWNAP
jgi:16S rRNA (cytosine1402-N4)-methyltransferase